MVLQLTIGAYDLGTPNPCVANRNATVRIQVTRNLYTPVFSDEGFYTQTIPETLGVNNRVRSVRADDRDRVSSL